MISACFNLNLLFSLFSRYVSSLIFDQDTSVCYKSNLKLCRVVVLEYADADCVHSYFYCGGLNKALEFKRNT